MKLNIDTKPIDVTSGFLWTEPRGIFPDISWRTILFSNDDATCKTLIQELSKLRIQLRSTFKKISVNIGQLLGCFVIDTKIQHENFKDAITEYILQSEFDDFLFHLKNILGVDNFRKSISELLLSASENTESFLQDKPCRLIHNFPESLRKLLNKFKGLIEKSKTLTKEDLLFLKLNTEL